MLHKKFVEDKIAEINKTHDKKLARELLDYHVEMTRNFQHERAIHLAITLFFAGLMIGSWVLVGLFSVSIGFNVDSLPALIMAILLTILEGFYIAYYYKLENRTEKLYILNKRIYAQIQDK